MTVRIPASEGILYVGEISLTGGHPVAGRIFAAEVILSAGEFL